LIVLVFVVVLGRRPKKLGGGSAERLKPASPNLEETGSKKHTFCSFDATGQSFWRYSR
jgi:hypothetical protein